MKRSMLAKQRCPVARAGEQLVDAWSFVILRELFRGNRRFEGLRVHTGMSPRSLSLRLAKLVDEGVLEKASCVETPSFHEYRLTPKGLELWPVLVMLRQWGERWAGPWGRGGVQPKLMHRGRGHPLTVQLVCAECGEPVDARSGEVEAVPGAPGYRAAFVATMKDRLA